MAQWWNSLPGFEKIFWYLAIPFTLVFIIRLVASVVGVGDSDNEMDGFEGGDDDGFFGEFRLFTLQNVVIFFTGFGWAGLFGAHRNFPNPLTVLFAAVVGLFLMFTVAAMYYFINRLSESGNINLANALNASGRVYLPIPAHKSGTGQVQVTIQGSLREVQAVTNGKELATGTPIKVVGVFDDETVLVERHK